MAFRTVQLALRATAPAFEDNKFLAHANPAMMKTWKSYSVRPPPCAPARVPWSLSHPRPLRAPAVQARAEDPQALAL